MHGSGQPYFSYLHCVCAPFSQAVRGVLASSENVDSMIPLTTFDQVCVCVCVCVSLCVCVQVCGN